MLVWWIAPVSSSSSLTRQQRPQPSQSFSHCARVRSESGFSQKGVSAPLLPFFEVILFPDALSRRASGAKAALLGSPGVVKLVYMVLELRAALFIRRPGS